MSNILRLGLAIHVCHNFIAGDRFELLDWLAPEGLDIVKMAAPFPKYWWEYPAENAAAMCHWQPQERVSSNAVEATTQEEISRMATTEWKEKQEGNAAVENFRKSSFFPQAPCKVVGVPYSRMMEMVDDDHSEVYQKLPVDRNSRRACHHIKWQDVMQLVNSTLEVAFSTTKLLRRDQLFKTPPPDLNYNGDESKGDLPFDIVMKHVVCARALSTTRKHRTWFTGNSNYVKRLQLLKENWCDGFKLDKGCKGIAQSLARSMSKTGMGYLPKDVANLKNMLDSLEQLYHQRSSVVLLQTHGTSSLESLIEAEDEDADHDHLILSTTQ
jgi:hypothetical protein